MPERSDVEAVLDALNRRDLDRLGELLHPDCEFHSRLVALDGELYRGIEGMRRYLADVDSVWEGFRVDLVSIEPSGDDALLMELHASGAARGSGMALAVPIGQVWTWRDGRPWRVQAFATREEAIAAARGER
jgi:ketosteroid isomerase-like protein